MNFKFDEDEQNVLDIIHEFGEKEAGPRAAKIDEQERFPEENRKKLAELGLMGICYPKNMAEADIPISPTLQALKNWQSIVLPPP